MRVMMEDSNVERWRAAKETRRNLRHRLACARCQRRKIRCDGLNPCSSCKRASVDCTDGNSVRLGDMPREKIARLSNRVQWLEGLLRSRCPDIDLTQGPDDLIDSPPGSHEAANSLVMLGRANSPRPQGQRAGVAEVYESHRESLLSHEIGLVALNRSQDVRYIGPSSGYFLARLMLSSKPMHESANRRTNSQEGNSLASGLVEALQGALPLPTYEQAAMLCREYFQVMHWQYPILHEPTFMGRLAAVLEASDAEPQEMFQIFMVLAIGATVANHRQRLHLPAESYCLSALKYFDRLNVNNSLTSIQSLCLLLVFTLCCSSMRLNVWYLNYQCIAAVLNLGLQRDISASAGVSALEQEMRTRVFWTVMTLDRRISTMMGRPIGLRDEACDLRLPVGVDDHALTMQSPAATPQGAMLFSVHLFRLTRLNSEIKYVANSVTRDAPHYAYPAIRDIHEWHSDMSDRLDQWASEIPNPSHETSYIRTICFMCYHNLQLVLLRPSPAIPRPSRESLRKCRLAARSNLHIFSGLYRDNKLVYTWDSFYSIVLSAITMLYCIKAVPELASSIDLDELSSDMGLCLSILSATGEHWQGAKRCRDVLEDLNRNVIRWLRERRARGAQPSSEIGTLHLNDSLLSTNEAVHLEGVKAASSVGSVPDLSQASTTDFESASGFMSSDCFDPFLGSGFPMEIEPTMEQDDIDAFMRSIFDNLIPNTSPFVG